MYNSSKLLFYQFHAIDWLLTDIHIAEFLYWPSLSGSVPWTADFMLQGGRISATGTWTTRPNFDSINFMLVTDYWYTYCRISILIKPVALQVPWTADLMLQCGRISAIWTIFPNFCPVNVMLVTDYWYACCRISRLMKPVVLCRGLQTLCCSAAEFQQPGHFFTSSVLSISC